jgi:hypothetical protein
VFKALLVPKALKVLQSLVFRDHKEFKVQLDSRDIKEFRVLLVHKDLKE